MINIFFKDTINEEMHNQKNYNIYTFESGEEKTKRVKSIVANQLLAFTYNMMSFEVEKAKIKDLMLTFANSYALEDEKIEEILKSLEDYKYKEKESEDNSSSANFNSNFKISTEFDEGEETN